MSISPQPSVVTARNHLLDRLPVHERNAILRGSHTERFAAGTDLTSRTVAGDAFFPVTAVVSILGCSADGESVPITLIGPEGLVGIGTVLEDHSDHFKAIVRAAGFAHRIDGEELRRQFRRGGQLQKEILRFAGSYLTQMSRQILCNRLHAEEARLAGWLLSMLDRSGEANIEIPLPALGDAIGSTANGTGRLLRGLAHASILSYQDNVISVIDREGLETCACGCYEAPRFTVDWRKEKR